MIEGDHTQVKGFNMKLIFTTIALLFIQSVNASAPNLDLLTEEQAKSVAKEFSANFVHTTVSPASSLGSIFGFEVGLLVGLTKTPETNKISKTFDEDADIEAIPHAGLIGGITIPFGITAEVSMVPERSASDVTFDHFSLGLKWTFTNHIKLPFDLAVRGHFSSSTLSYSDTVNNSSTGGSDVDSTISYETNSYGVSLLGSVNALILEPYAGIGYVSTDTDIGVSATTSVSIFDFSGSDSYNAENSGLHYFGGVNVNLFLIKVGAEVSQIMDLTKYSFKLSAYF